MAKSSTVCATPDCIKAIVEYGPNYHAVHDCDNGTKICERCGGILIDGKWEHRCVKCRKDVEPGQLAGLFVPYMCKDCSKQLYQDEKRSGNVCTLCGTPRSFCCC